MGRKQGTLKLEGWKPIRPSEADTERFAAIRELVVKAVFAKWNKDKEPATLLSIFFKVQDDIKELLTTVQRNRWKKEWRIPGKRTIDRRVNEAADPRFYEDGVPKIVAVSAGVYQPNPTLFVKGEN